MEQKYRPKCEKKDDLGFCPKGVPALFPDNYDAWLVFLSLATQSVDAMAGLIRFDGRLVRDLCDLFGVGEQSYQQVAGKVLFLVDLVNSNRLTKQKEETSGQGAKDEKLQ